MLPALFTTVLFSISGTCAQRTSTLLGGVTANLIRIILAAGLLGLWSHLFGIGIRGDSFPVFVLSGVVGFGIGDVALYQALPRIGSRLSILLVHCVAAPFAALVEWVWLDTTLTPQQIFCGLVILGGVALALAPGKHLDIDRRTLWVGTACGVVAALCQALGAVLSRKANAVATASGLHVDGINAAYQRILGGVVIAVLAYWIAKRHGLSGSAPSATSPSGVAARPSPLAPHVWPWILANCLAGPVLGVACYQWALSTTPTGVVLPVVALTPLVIIPFSVYVEGERPTGRSLAGGVIGVLGVVGLAVVTHGSR